MKTIQYPYLFETFDDSFLLINMVGEHIFLSPDDFECLISENYDKLTERAKIGLYSHHFISSADNKDLVENLLAVKLRSRKDFLRYFTTLHMVVLTLRCNCHCDYCHASSKNLVSKETDMSLETAKHVLDVILQLPSSEVKIEFQGGEPSLNWTVLEFFVLEGEKKVKEGLKKSIYFVICTNLINLSDEQIEFCKNHHVEISSSCDGPKFFYDLHRHALDGSSAYEHFIKTLQKVRKIKGDNSVNALLTITKDNLHHLPEVIDHYMKLGFHNVFLRALNPYGYAKQNEAQLGYSLEEFVQIYRDALEYIFTINQNGTFFAESYAALIFERIMTPFSTGFVDLQSPTGAGIAGAIYYYNGDVYPSDEGRMLAAMGDCHFRMGNVYYDDFKTIFSSKVMKDLVQNSCVESMPGCSTCAYSPYCGADPIRYYTESGDLMGKRYDSGFCRRNKGAIKVILDIIKENDPKKIAILWSWVQRRPLEDWQCGKHEE